MDYEIVKKVIHTIPKGTFTTIRTSKKMSTYKGVEDIIEKTTDFVGRLGVEYDHMKSTIENRQNGVIPAQNDGLKWGQWEEYPYIVEHKGQKYLRVSLTPNTRFKTKYYKNGVEVNRQDIESLVLKNNFSKNIDQPTVLTINVDTIRSLA